MRAYVYRNRGFFYGAATGFVIVTFTDGLVIAATASLVALALCLLIDALVR